MDYGIGSKGNTEDMVSMIETNGAQDKDQELLLLEQEMITNVSCINILIK